MKFSLLALLLSSGVLGVAAKEKCGPRPVPIRDIKFTDKDGQAIHNYELHGNARIVEPAPLDVARALRIDSLYSYALLKDTDISPSQMRDVTFEMSVYIESIRPAIANAPDPNQQNAYGWVMSHDNGGFDRAIFLHDERFNGMGIAPGYKFPANREMTLPPVKKWIQIVAIWRQGGECEMRVDNVKYPFSQRVIGRNNNGLKDISLGAPQARRYGKENDNDVWIKDIKIFDYALDDDELDDLKCNFEDDLEPNIDCGQGDLVFSCTDCPTGNGASGCAGDCMWNKDLGTCTDDNDNDISCGDHDAPDCSQCDATSSDTSGCSGDCAWIDGECRDDEYKPPVDCGDHEATSCGACPNGKGASGCAGECMWDPKGLCIPDNDDDISCGDHDVRECSHCDATASDTSGCSGECTWIDGQCRDDDYKPPVDCGDHEAATCGECPNGQGASGCAGECMWSGPHGACIKDNDKDVDCGDHDAASCGDCDAVSSDTSKCAGQCEWSDDLGACISPPSDEECEDMCPAEPPINCGHKVAESCDQCNVGNTSTGCAADCMWDPLSKTCVDDEDKDTISCGDHDASSCSNCDADANTTHKCAGDCKWIDGDCRDDDYEPPVQCDATRTAQSCSQCVTGPGPAKGCHTDCVFNAATKQCVDKDPSDPPVNCGDHQALSCDQCYGGEAGCKGQCKWFGDGNKCMPPGFKPVNCGGGKLAESCDTCGAPSGCAGECEWNQVSKKCNKRPGPNTPSVQCGDHIARICSQCGKSTKIHKPNGYYYTSDYRPDKHEIVHIGAPRWTSTQMFQLKKHYGDRHVPRGQVTIEYWMNDPKRNGNIKNHRISNTWFRENYCTSSHQKWPAQIKFAYTGYVNPHWKQGYIVVFHGNAWIFVFSDNKNPQMLFKKATDAQLRAYKKM